MLLLHDTTTSGQLSLPYRPRCSPRQAMAAASPVSPSEPIPLAARFARLKQALVRGKEDVLLKSWQRLLRELRKEIREVASLTPDAVIPAIDFTRMGDPAAAESFFRGLRRRGVGIIRGVVPRRTALEWRDELRAYVGLNPSTRGHPPDSPQLYEMYWSPSQIRARAHPRVVQAQRFAMGVWHHAAAGGPALVSPAHPITYADRFRVVRRADPARAAHAKMGGGSVERWEPDGYGLAGTYTEVLGGRWEDYDPWDSARRLQVNADLYGVAGNCSVFRMFQGLLCLGQEDPDAATTPAGAGGADAAADAGGTALRVCPMLQLTTAYVLLRPFFLPRVPLAAAESEDAYLKPSNWLLAQPQTSILHGALPSYAHEVSALLHPHLQLDRSLIDVPRLRPGDYLLWHPDLVHAAPHPLSSSPDAYSTRRQQPQAPSPRGDDDGGCVGLYIPACPLTQTNALYLARQRRAFLLGHAGPDFVGGGGSSTHGESNHVGRPGVQDVSDAGGDEALQAMGLLPWTQDDGDSGDEGPRLVVRMADAILFPDRYGMQQ